MDTDDNRLAAVTGLCADGPMAGTEVRVAVDSDGQPPAVIAVDGHTYVLALQSSPVIGRPWRHTVVRDGDLYAIDGGVSAR